MSSHSCFLLLSLDSTRRKVAGAAELDNVVRASMFRASTVVLALIEEITRHGPVNLERLAAHASGLPLLMVPRS